jgi:hypothetical protein
VLKVKKKLFSVPSAIPNLEKNNQALPHMHNEELALTSQMEIPMARTTMVEQTTLNQTMTMTGVDQMVAMTAVDQPAPGTVIDPAAETLTNTASPNYFAMTTDEMTTIPQVDAPAMTAPAEAPATTAIDEMTTILQVDAPAMTAPADFLVTTAPVDASATISPVDALVIPSVGSGTGKKAGIMRPNTHSTTARYVSLFCRNISVY